MKAHTTLWRLVASPKNAVAYLKDKLPPTPRVKPERLRQLVHDLDHEKYSTREAAAAELTNLGVEAWPELRQALAGNPSSETRRRAEAILAAEVPWKADSPGRVRRLPAIQVLERIGSPPACKILDALAKGAPGAWETQEAKASLERLARRTVVIP